MLAPWKKSYDQPRQHIKKQRHYFTDKILYSQGYGFSSGHVWMWELDCEESWALKNWCFWTVVLEKTLESPLDYKEIQPVHSKGDQPLMFFGTTDAKAETPILWPPDTKNWLIPWCWERLKAGGEGDDRGWDSWMASSTQWTWVWANSERWWRTGKPGMLQAHGITKSQTWFSEWTTKKLRQLDGSFVNLRMEYNHKHLTNIYWCLQCSRHHLIFYWKCRKKKLD